MGTYIYNGNIGKGYAAKQQKRFEINSTYPGIKYVSNPGFRRNYSNQFTESSSSENSEEKEKTARQRFCEFGDDSTVHGVKYVTNPKFDTIRRIIWGSILAFMVTWLLNSVVNSFLQFKSRPINSIVGVTYVPDLVFPALTLCNYNQIRASRVDNETISLLNAIFDVTAQETTDVDWEAYNHLWSKENLIVEILHNATHDIKDMLIDCTWRNTVCDHRNFSLIVTDWGLCYTFNNPLEKDDILRVNQPGSGYGLFLRLNVEQSEYTFSENYGAGFKLYLHPQGVRPLVRELGFSVSPGFETSIAVTETKVDNLAAPYSDCRFSTDLLKSGDKYTVAACLQECKETFVIGQCKCRDFRYAGTDPVCNPDILVDCVPETEAAFIENNQNTACDCPLACDSVVYNTRLSQAYFPSKLLIREITQITNYTEDDIRENFLDLRVYFEELSYNSVTQVAAYSLASLQSDIGGSMGLLIGMSIMSVVEFIDFVLVSLWYKCFKKHRR